MCGIAAILLHPQKRSPEIWREIKTMFERNLVFNEDRGRDATGLAIFHQDKKVNLLKATQSASEFVQTPEFQAQLESINENTTLILGHTRHPTKGDPSKSDNNHPLQAGSVFGVHNGHIENDDDLFDVYGFTRQGEVDSEIIFRLLESVSAQDPAENYLTEACNHIQRLKGKYTFLSIDNRSPEKLLVVKHQNPLNVHFHAQWNALIFSSHYIFLRKAFGHAVVTEVLPNDRLLCFDANLLPRFGSQPTGQCALFASGD